MRDRKRERLVLVAVADNVLTAELLRDQLREAGVPSTMRNREGGAVIVGGLGGTFEISVLEGDADLASAVIGGDRPPDALPSPTLPGPRPRPKRRRWWR